MFLLDVFRSFLPVRNPLGFGATDFILLTVAAALAFDCATFGALWLSPRFARLLHARDGACCYWRLCRLRCGSLLLAHHPIPTPTVSDEFSHLLVADTLLHFRLANPPHPLHQFFETFFVLQEPSYASIYALGQGMVLALGRMLFGHPWAGVALATAALCSLCYWMLRAWTTPGWALAGGLLCVMQFGPLCQWMNSYWCGSVPAAAGCLVFGALPRLRENGRPRDAALLGLGLALNLLTRPYESIFLVLSVLLFLAPAFRTFVRAIPMLVLVIAPAVVLTLAQNKQVTGSWTTLPYVLSRYQYGVPTTFTFQPNPIPSPPIDARAAARLRHASCGSRERPGNLRQICATFLIPRALLPFLLDRAPLSCPSVLLTCVAEIGGSCGSRPLCFSSVWDLISIRTFYPHYIAAVTCLCVLVAVTGFERLSRLSIRGTPVGQDATHVILFLCAAHFLFWYGVHLLENQPFTRSLEQFQTWDIINHDDPEGRIEIHDQLSKAPGKQLVFVRYWPQHTFQEWVHNAADIDASPIVWARDLGAAENAKLLHYYPNRSAWLLEPDAHPTKLTPYTPVSALQFETPP